MHNFDTASLCTLLSEPWCFSLLPFVTKRRVKTKHFSKLFSKSGSSILIAKPSRTGEENHNHRPCRWYAQAPLGPFSSPAYRLIELSTTCISCPTTADAVMHMPKAPSDEGKRSTVAVVNDSPVGCQSRNRAARRRLDFCVAKRLGERIFLFLFLSLRLRLTANPPPSSEGGFPLRRDWA